MNRMFKGLAGLLLGLLPSATMAEDLALILSNRSYDGMANLPSGQAAAGLAQDLQARGWSVFAATDATPQEMRDTARKLRAAMQRTPEPDRVIIAVAGLMVSNDRDSWLLAEPGRNPDALNVGTQGISLGALAEIAGQAPGRAVLLIGVHEAAFEVGPGVRAGAGDVAAPQGVMVVNGPMPGLRRWTRDALLSPDNTIDQALRALPENARSSGYSSRSDRFAAAGAQPGSGRMGEMAYWNAVNDIGTIDAYRAYLGRYPSGIFANDARTRVAELTRDPLEVAREAEQALGLNREARRQIQRNLALLGFDPRGIDGVFGRGSRAAITAFQRSAGFRETGYLGGRQVNELQRQADVRAAELAREAQLRREAEERADRQYWQQLGRDEASLRRYLERYPDGLFAETAQARLDLILEERLAAAEARERTAWNDARSRDTIAAYRGFLSKFPNGSFAEEAQARIAELEAEAANAAQIEQLRKVEKSILPNQEARLVVEKILAARGLKPGEVDGKFTRDTRRALRRFQREQGLPVNGFVTQNTMVVLMLSR